MRVLKLHHPKGHPYWQKNEYKVQLPDGSFFNLKPLFGNYGNIGGYEIFIEKGDVYFIQCGSSSGGGKTRSKDDPIKIVCKHQYDKIEYIGTPLEISKELQTDLRDNGIS